MVLSAEKKYAENTAFMMKAGNRWRIRLASITALWEAA
jgi:hypothetical protein